MARTGDGRIDAGRGQSGRRRLSAVRHGRDRSADAARRRCWRRTDGAFGAAADPALLTRLDLKTGDRITIGNAAIELRAALTGEPDKLAGGIGLGPRVLISEAALRATGLLQPGSLVRWQYRLRLPARHRAMRAVAAIEKQAQTTISRCRLGYPHPQQGVAAARAQRRALHANFSTLVGLTTLLVGGVGVANAVASHLARKRDAIATMKALGATGGGVFADLLHADRAGRAVRHAHRRRARRGVAVRHRVGLRRDHSAAGRAVAASGACWRCRSSMGC